MGIRIGVLGPLEVRDAGGQLLPFGGSRLRSLLIRLAITDGQPVPVDRLAVDLWPGDGPADAANAVQALVSRLRSVAGKEVVTHGPAGYRLTIPSGDVDALVFERLVATGRGRLADGDYASAAELLRQGLRLWRGPALADVADAAFAAGTITRLSELRLAATEERIEADLALGRAGELAPELEELAAEHPLRERLRGQLMRALQRAGRQADALQAFEETRRRLAEELGADPSPGLSAIYLAILRGELPGTTAAGPGWALASGTAAEPSSWTAAEPSSGAAGGPSPRGAADTVPGAARPQLTRAGLGALPAQITSFVGREDELDQVARLLAGARLVTLTGPGGAGKTRLSVEAGARIADDVPGGVWFVPLAPVRDAADVPQAILAALGADGAWSADPAEAARLAALEPLDRLSEMLAGRSLVLVLDNCEHVLDAVARLAVRVLADEPGVRILATSREPIGLTGETLCPVPSLSLPPEGAGPGQVASSPAVRLFADRAAAVRPGFRIDDQTADPVARICRALDGIPLAIELAAARVRTLTPAQVAERLDDRFALLSVGTRAALPRHQTLRAIVDWSWDLLDDTERTILRQLSVFSGGATPGSAEQVCSAPGPGRTVIEVIASLVDKSLVVATGDGEVRYRLLETVRAYAAAKLADTGESEQLAAAHAEHFLALAERAEPELRARDQLIWLTRLQAEYDNFAAALRHAVAAGDAVSALRFVAALAWFWISRDYEAEAAEWALQALRLAGETPPPGLTEAYTIATMLSIVSQLTASHGSQSQGAEQQLRPQGAEQQPRPQQSEQPQPQQSEQPRPQQSEQPGQLVGALARLCAAAGDSHPLLAVAAPMLAGLSEGQGGVRRNLEAARDHPDPWVRAARRALAGHLSIHDGDIESAGADLAEAYSLFAEIGDRWGLVICLGGLADVAIGSGHAAGAVRALEEARGYLGEGIGGNWSQTMRVPLGRARARAGDIAGARADLEEGVRFAEQIGEADDAARGYIELAELSRRDSDLEAARSILQQAMDIAERNARPDMPLVTATVFSRLGCVAEQGGDLNAAAIWQQRALSALAGIPTPILPLNPTLALVVEGIAALAATRGEPARAAELLGLARALHGFDDAGSLEVARARKVIAAALSEADADAAYARGRAMGPADALALAP
jgi:predicted ATPase/DNA-binding SARP family transcriptional activator